MTSRDEKTLSHLELVEARSYRDGVLPDASIWWITRDTRAVLVIRTASAGLCPLCVDDGV